VKKYEVLSLFNLGISIGTHDIEDTLHLFELSSPLRWESASVDNAMEVGQVFLPDECRRCTWSGDVCV
jgi:hypothetical protein